MIHKKNSCPKVSVIQKLNFMENMQQWSKFYVTLLGPNGTRFAPGHFRAQKSHDFWQCCGSGMFIPDPGS